MKPVLEWIRKCYTTALFAQCSRNIKSISWCHRHRALKIYTKTKVSNSLKFRAHAVPADNQRPTEDSSVITKRRLGRKFIFSARLKKSPAWWSWVEWIKLWKILKKKAFFPSRRAIEEIGKFAVSTRRKIEKQAAKTEPGERQMRES